ncbi:MAG: GAF domain-containing protein [Chloroflexota bacterium]
MSDRTQLENQTAQRSIFAFLTLPPFEEDKRRSAQFANAISLSLIVLITLLLIARIAAMGNAFSRTNMVLAGLTLVMIVVQVILRAGYVHLAGLTITLMGWAAMTYQAFVNDGVRDEAVLAYFPLAIIASLLIGWRASLAITGLSIAAVWAMAVWGTSTGEITQTFTPVNTARDATAILLLAAYLNYLLVNSLRSSLEQARAATKDLQASNLELNNLRTELEKRVETRTAQLEKRASQLEAISAVARSLSAIQDMDALLPVVARLVGERFGHYHTGIFLMSEDNQYVVLRATNSIGGQKMLARGHRLPVEATSIVGYAASRGEARIARDVGTEAFYLNNPDLPETRSEMAVPLRVAERVIGVLDVHSRETNAFGNEDIEVLRTLADQIAIAIENTRLFGETRRALNESQAIYQRYVRQEWARFTRRFDKSGYRYDGAKTVALTAKVEREDINSALEKGEIIITSPSENVPAALAVPVKSRGQVIGVIHVQAADKNHQWSQDEVVLTQAAAERAAIAMENIRLLNEAQRRAAKERTISAVSAKLGTSINLHNVLQVAVEELGRVLPGSEVALQLRKEE